MNPQANRHYILGTAGHIDHGKTSLVRALTGTDTDRLPQERARGMTIELGFASLTVGDTVFGVVDVPGHERFIKTMVAGATGIDVALIVVAADDSVMPQTLEHVEILHLLGVRRGVVALTKVDLVDTEIVDLVVEDIQMLLAATPFADAEICRVSSTTGYGIDDLKAAILAVSDGGAANSSERPFRLAVDRVFSVPGRGTVVTGSVLRGAVVAGETLEVLPEGFRCRVRDLQTHGVSLSALACGQRAAINISGIDRALVQRGCELATPGFLEPSRIMNVRLKCLSSCVKPLKSASVVRLGIGTREFPVRVVLFGEDRLEPGAAGFAQLRSGQSFVAVYGQRFIIRDESATRTIGGGMVLSPVARRRRGGTDTELEILRRLDTGDATKRVEQVLRLASFDAPPEIRICARAGVEPAELAGILDRLETEKRWVPVAGTGAARSGSTAHDRSTAHSRGVYVVPAALDDLTHRLRAWLERYHGSHSELPGRNVDSVLGWLERVAGRGLGRPLLDHLTHNGTVKLIGRFVCLPAFAPSLSAGDEKLLATILGRIREGGFQPPTLDSLASTTQADRKRLERLATLAVALGDLVQVQPKMYLHAEVEGRLRRIVADRVVRSGSVTVAEVREALNSSRKYVVPFMEYLDRIGFTKRIDDRRVLVEPVGDQQSI